MNKLEFKHIAPYAPYGLKWSLQGLKVFTMTGATEETLYTQEGTVFNWGKHNDLPQALFPILRPLSDLMKPTDIFGYTSYPMQEFYVMYGSGSGSKVQFEKDYMNNILYTPYKSLSYETVITLVKWHFDVFGLIKLGLAIDINTLE